MPGSRGPVPKPSSQRRRRNRPEVETDVAPAGAVAPGAPEPEDTWHPIARDWFVALGNSGQAAFYEPSDWAMARLGAELMSKLAASDKPSAQMLASLLQITSSLLATEGDRRRLRLELARGEQVDPDEEAADATVTDLRSRLGG